MKNLITEFIGTFFLVLAIGLTGDPLVIGSALMIMVYMGGHISGAHYNPAVTLGLFMRGKINTSDSIQYIAAQIAGALIAALAVSLLKTPFAPAPATDVSMLSAIIVEATFTFALMLVILNTAVSNKTEGNSFYGLAIGFTVFVAASAGGGISGGAFNPAVGIGPIIINTIIGDGGFGSLIIYLIGPCTGAALASLVFSQQEQ